MEDSRRDMILCGLDAENHQKLSQAKFDLYSRSSGDVEYRISVYHDFVRSVLPYVEFNFDEEALELSEEDKRADFLAQFKAIDWRDALNHLPVAQPPV